MERLEDVNKKQEKKKKITQIPTNGLTTQWCLIVLQTRFLLTLVRWQAHH